MMVLYLVYLVAISFGLAAIWAMSCLLADLLQPKLRIVYERRGVDGDTVDPLVRTRPSFACCKGGAERGTEKSVGQQDCAGAGSEPADVHSFWRKAHLRTPENPSHGEMGAESPIFYEQDLRRG